MTASTEVRNYFPVTGCSVSQGVFDRLPVQELATDHPYQWTLFILGWAYIKDTPIPFPGVVQPPWRNNTSLMELGGIHGKPYREWPGDRRTPAEAQVDFSYQDKKDTNPSPPRFGGYCHHSAITFPSWHRPYVMLVEQAIGEYAENIAQQIENSHPGEVGRWVNEAKKLRFPYWDWADPKVEIEGLPALFYTDELTILCTEQKTVTVPNPLTGFTFPYIPKDFENNSRVSAISGRHHSVLITSAHILQNGLTAYFTKWEKTYRYVESSPNPPGSDYQNLQALVKSITLWKPCRDVIFSLQSFSTMLTDGHSYDEFSNTRNQSRQDGEHNNTGSLEGVHNSMHGNIVCSTLLTSAKTDLCWMQGGNGHMVVALWDWCYPEYWMGDGFTIDKTEQPWTLEKGTYSTAYSQRIESDGEWGSLIPFRHPDGTYWTNKETRFFTSNAYPKYYSYKEFLGVKVDKASASLKERQEARARIAKYYGVDPQKAASSIHAPSWTHITVPSASEVPLPPNFQPIKNFRVFKVLVRLAEHAIGTSYHFNLYYKEELVGSVTVFTRESSSPCKACAVRRAADSVVRGVITIPSRIINDIIVHSSMPQGQNTMDNTVKLITKALTGKLEDLGGKVIASAQGGTVAAPVLDEHAAPRTIHPAEVSLLSAAVAEDVKDKNQPVHFFDWQHHTDIFPGGWKAEISQVPAAAH
ncbi:common central domain of tyrosinase-domain-containing protein [Lanmaoa asiatica]|nr:common central domain of tyrosinase-domain-containing protein [Lanmaoa asiatica]